MWTDLSTKQQYIYTASIYDITWKNDVITPANKKHELNKALKNEANYSLQGIY